MSTIAGQRILGCQRSVAGNLVKRIREVLEVILRLIVVQGFQLGVIELEFRRRGNSVGDFITKVEVCQNLTRVIWKTILALSQSAHIHW
jgi:hypothetical protein